MLLAVLALTLWSAVGTLADPGGGVMPGARPLVPQRAQASTTGNANDAQGVPGIPVGSTASSGSRSAPPVAPGLTDSSGAPDASATPPAPGSSIGRAGPGGHGQPGTPGGSGAPRGGGASNDSGSPGAAWSSAPGGPGAARSPAGLPIAPTSAPAGLSILPATDPGLSAAEGVFLVTTANDGGVVIYFIAQSSAHSILATDVRSELLLNPLWPVRSASPDEVLAFTEAAPIGNALAGLLAAPAAADPASSDLAAAQAEPASTLGGS